MSLWGIKDDKTSTGTVEIEVVGTTAYGVGATGTAFTTEAKAGDYLYHATSEEYYQIVSISADWGASCIEMRAGIPGATPSVAADGDYTLSERPGFLTNAEGTSSSGDMGDISKVYGVDTDEMSGGSTGTVAEVAVSDDGNYYHVGDSATTTVTFSGDGAGATGTVTLGGATGTNVVASVTVADGGSGYSSAPTVTVSAPVRTIATEAIVDGASQIAYTAHGLIDDLSVTYSANGGGASCAPEGDYYVVVVDADNFQIAGTVGGTGYVFGGASGNAAQTITINGYTATVTAALSAAVGGGPTHSGWVRRIVGTGGRAGRIQYETLVAFGASGSEMGDAEDDIQFPDS